MRGTKIFICLIALSGALLLDGNRAQAADSDSKFAIKGAGAVPCSAYVEARTRRLLDRLGAFEGWLHGYLSAYNRSEAQTYDIVAWQGNAFLLGVLENYCKQNPDHRFELAVSGLINALRPDRITAQSDMVQITTGDASRTIYKEVVLRLQKALTQKKMFSGKADGRFGEDTKKGIEAFQKSQNIPVTGFPDQRTLLALLPSSAPPAATPAKPAAPATQAPAKPPARSQQPPAPQSR
jgi:hypothetical protein